MSQVHNADLEQLLLPPHEHFKKLQTFADSNPQANMCGSESPALLLLRGERGCVLASACSTVSVDACFDDCVTCAAVL